jgi:hypothetical protein
LQFGASRRGFARAQDAGVLKPPVPLTASAYAEHRISAAFPGKKGPIGKIYRNIPKLSHHKSINLRLGNNPNLDY